MWIGDGPVNAHMRPRDRSRKSQFGIGGCESQEIRHETLAAAGPAVRIEPIVKFVRKNVPNPAFQRTRPASVVGPEDSQATRLAGRIR